MLQILLVWDLMHSESLDKSLYMFRLYEIHTCQMSLKVGGIVTKEEKFNFHDFVLLEKNQMWTMQREL